MTAIGRLLTVVLLLASMSFAPALAASRVALVIGNSDYQHTSKLKNPRNDATALSAALRRLDFDVLEGFDLDDLAFRRMARDFALKMEGAEVALLYYAGHGLQVNGRNYLLPVNAALKRRVDLDFEAIPVELIMTHMEQDQRINIVLLDACRNNPLVDDLARGMGTRSTSLGRGLARIETGVGTYVGFSTQPGNVALDGEGANSPFAEALVKNIELPNLDIETLMRQVRAEVIVATSGRQVPWGNSSLVGRGFVFKATATPETGNEPTRERAGPLPTVTDQANIEIAFWNSIKDTGNPHLLEAYLSEYPSGRFAKLADILLKAAKVEARAKAPLETEAKRAEVEPPRQSAIDPKSPASQPAEPASADPEEAGFFLAVKTSRDIKLIEAYLARYPKGKFAKDARELIEEIEAKQASLETSPDPDEGAPRKVQPVELKKPAAKKAKQERPEKLRKKRALVEPAEPVKRKKKRKGGEAVAKKVASPEPAKKRKKENKPAQEVVKAAEEPQPKPTKQKAAAAAAVKPKTDAAPAMIPLPFFGMMGGSEECGDCKPKRSEGDRP